MSAHRRAGAFLLSAGLALAAGGLPAATVYVIDQLLVGIHEDRALDSPIIQVVPTGTALEILDRDDYFTQVRTEAGVTGWVDSSYVTEEKPARLVVEDLRERLAARERELARAKQSLGEARARVQGDAPAPADRDDAGAEEAPALRARVDELEKTLTAERAQRQALEERGALVAVAAKRDAEVEIEALRSQLEEALRRGPPSPPPPTDELRELQRLAEENRELKAEVTQMKERGPAAAPAPALWQWDFQITRGARWTLVALGFALLLAFFLGAFWIDYANRRRHGGFRI